VEDWRETLLEASPRDQEIKTVRYSATSSKPPFSSWVPKGLQLNSRVFCFELHFTPHITSPQKENCLKIESPALKTLQRHVPEGEDVVDSSGPTMRLFQTTSPLNLRFSQKELPAGAKAVGPVPLGRFFNEATRKMQKGG
jgi:hypothetical protein